MFNISENYNSLPSLKISYTRRSIDVTRDEFQRDRLRYVGALYPSITSLTFTSAVGVDEDNIIRNKNYFSVDAM